MLRHVWNYTTKNIAFVVEVAQRDHKLRTRHEAIRHVLEEALNELYHLCQDRHLETVLLQKHETDTTCH